MPKTISLQFTHPSIPPGRVEGFRFLWAFYVSGYDPKKHCQPCFKGRRVDEFCTPTARSGPVIALDRMDQFPYVYVCGVGAGPDRDRWKQNLHLPMRFKQGGVVEATTYNGYSVVARDAELVEIPPLPDGWNGLPLSHTRCRNFRFAVGAFGSPFPSGNPE